MARGVRSGGVLKPVNEPAVGGGPAAGSVAEPCQRGRKAWLALAVLLGVVAAVGQWVPNGLIDWQPGRAWPELWRAVTAVAVHYSGLHLAANLAGTLGVAALGWTARLPLRCAWAWAAAWPLTQIGLSVQPKLEHYGGLSGVLHAGVAVAGLHLACRTHGRRRCIGMAVLVVLIAKVLSETPWGPPLRQVAGWDIAIAPLAHTTGLLAGLLCGAASEAWVQARMRFTRAVVE